MSNDYDLVDFLRAIRRYWWIALLIVIVLWILIGAKKK